MVYSLDDSFFIGDQRFSRQKSSVPTDPDRLKRFLACETPDKQWVADKLIHLLSGEAIIPPFSAAAIKLGQLSRDENCQMEDVAEVIQMDAGLASDIIKVASSVGFAARRVASIDQALMMIGMTEVRRIALSMGVMKNFEHLKSQVDWNSFWLHSILVARLTERVAAAYRPPSGSEYLAGLLHDCGKLVLEHYFPEDFDRIIIRATERGSGHVSVEKEFIGISHAQIGAGVCECLQAHLEVIRAVWYHHDPFDAEEGSQPDNSKFLAACVGVADALTNYKQINIYGARIMDYDKPFEELPEWQFLSQYQMNYGLDLDLDLEEEKAREDLKSFGLGGDDNGDGK